MEYMFTTGTHSYLMPSEQIEELSGLAFNTYCFALPDFTEEHIELEAWKSKWAAQLNHSTLFIQSSPELVSLMDADGIILKKDDLPPDVVRRKIGSEKKIGGMAGIYEDALNLVLEGVDFIILGPMRAERGENEIGMERLRTMVSMLKKNSVPVPVWTYGGITPDDLEALDQLGIEGVSVSSFILSDDDIRSKAELFKRLT